MVRFAASEPALVALVTLHLCRSGLRLSELARSTGIGVSTMQRALGLLVADGVVERVGRRYLVTEGPSSRASLGFAMAFLAVPALARALSANPAVESVLRDDVGILVVTRRFPDPLDEARLRSTIDALRTARPEIYLRLVGRHEIRGELLADAAMRERLSGMTTVSGDREGYAVPVVRPSASRPVGLGRLSPAVRQPSDTAIRRFARTHGLRRIVAFGSAVRDDVGPASDIDLLVELVEGATPGAFELSSMVADAEQLFDRDVDIIVGQPRDRLLRRAIQHEGVVLHDAG